MLAQAVRPVKIPFLAKMAKMSVANVGVLPIANVASSQMGIGNAGPLGERALPERALPAGPTSSPPSG
jgi:hypothetical protein